MGRMRHTMGHDWGGRKRENPLGCPRVSRTQVEALALSLGLSVRREGLGMWLVKRGEQWFTLGQTNYVALENLRRQYPATREEE